jgi:DNA-3-methyladenine glycosylase II
MARIVRAVGPCLLEPGVRGDYFTTLLRVIVGQQLSTRAAESIWRRVAGLHPRERRIRPVDVLSATGAELRSAGLSAAKVAYMKDLATKVSSGALSFRRIVRLDDAAIVSELVKVNGLGRWSAEMFLIFKLGRPDVWPVDDLGIRNAVARHYRRSFAAGELQELAEPWRPHRSVASWYLWRSLAIDPV